MERPPEPTMTTLRTSGRGSFGRTLADIRRAISEGELRTRSPSFGAKSPTEGAAMARATAVGTGRRRVAVRCGEGIDHLYCSYGRARILPQSRCRSNNSNL